MPRTVAGGADGWGARAYPYLIAVSFPLGLWLGNLGEEPTAFDVVVSFVLTLTLVATADRLLRRWLRDVVTRSLVLALLVIGLLGYGHALELLSRWLPIRHRHFAACWLVAMGLAVAGVVWLRGSRPMFAASRFLQRTSPLLVAVQLAWAWPLMPFQPAGMSEPQTAAVGAAARPPRSRPDIYYIILDGYARQDMLGRLYDFDNGEFLEALERRGFYVASGARSNYAQTRLSLSSSLSMEYLSPREPGESDQSYQERIRRLRKQSRVVARVREAGYRYRYVGSMYFPVDAAADEELSPPPARRTYLRAFLGTTLLEPVLRAAGFERLVQDPVAVHEYQFHNIARPKEDPAPLFTFAHVACPHEPYVFDHRGPLLRPIPAAEATAHDYVEQLRYLNSRVLQLLDAIERTSGRDAVVLLQADHGTALLGMSSQPRPDQLSERMAIFSAYRVPERVRRLLYPTITPVNSFRVVFNGLFDDDFPLLEDRSFYSSYETPFRLIEVP